MCVVGLAVAVALFLVIVVLMVAMVGMAVIIAAYHRRLHAMIREVAEPHQRHVDQATFREFD